MVEGSVPIPAAFKDRAKAAMENPVAQVSEYKQLLSDILAILVGLRLENFEDNTGCGAIRLRRTRY